MADDDSKPPLTRLLHLAARGEVGAADKALPVVYRELRAIAQRRMAHERRDHTLQATALVHETWMRLVAADQARWQDRASFYRAAAAAMRQVLVDHARRRSRLKRGGEAHHSADEVEQLAAPGPDLADPTTFLQLDEAIAKLEHDDPRAGAIVRMRFFAGLDIEETASALGLSRRTVLREWAFARARLFAAMGGVDDE